MKEFLLVLLSCFMFITALMVLTCYSDKIGCTKTAKILNYKSQYSYWAGCIIIDKNGNKKLLNQMINIQGE